MAADADKVGPSVDTGSICAYELTEHHRLRVGAQKPQHTIVELLVNRHVTGSTPRFFTNTCICRDSASGYSNEFVDSYTDSPAGHAYVTGACLTERVVSATRPIVLIVPRRTLDDARS